jgi:hypothetical protein
MAATQTLTDTNVNDYIHSISNGDLQTLVGDLKSDFDGAISNRFKVSSNQSNSLSSTPDFFKTQITSAFNSLLTIRQNGATGDFTISGLNPSGSGEGLQNTDLKITITHSPDCTWSVTITITK